MFSFADKISLLIIIVLIAIGVSVTPILAYVMSSDNFKIQADSVNIGGGLGTSDNFQLEDTVGENGTGYSTSTNYKMHAGYQQMDQNVYITLAVPDITVLAPAIGGLSGGTANGSSTINVLTNNNLGYSLSIRASTSPALKHISTSTSFANYTLAGADPDFAWSVSSTDSEFGFSPEGGDVVARYLDDGSVCGAGSGNVADKCWEAVSTTNMAISQSNSANEPSGADTYIKYRAESGNSHLQESGSYRAYIIVTAYAN